MKYRLYFAAKISAILVLVVGLEALLVSFYPRSPKPLPWLGTKPSTGALLFFLGTFCIWTLGIGAAILSYWDQRRRCRSCLRRLIMPLESGSWANLVTSGRPRTASICPYGHGTLHEEELKITGRAPADWEPHDDDIWKELESYGPAESHRS